MALQLKSLCERCGQGIEPSDKAYICVYECTFCHACTMWLGFNCPNCGGELVRRPRPKGAEPLKERANPSETGNFGVMSR
ncbi:MAG: DUF1272 domain-containing protein [Acidobacteria bacterium]|nr:DUF1272 domain-containing protein [Acidobacteriota bacterium]